MQAQPVRFPTTRQGVRNLDQMKGSFLPFSGGLVPPAARVKNVGDQERAASLVTGAALVGGSLAQPSMGSAIVAALGAALIYRGFTGECEVYRMLGRNTAPIEQAPEEMAYRTR